MTRHALLSIMLVAPLGCEKSGSTTPGEARPQPAPVTASEEEEKKANDDDWDDEDDEEWDDEDGEPAADGETGYGFGGRGKAVASVTHGAATVEGNLDKDIIRRIIRAHVNEVRSCYDGGLARNSSLSGSVTIEFTIAATGDVTSSKSASSTTLADAEVAECIAGAFTRWRFPKPSGGEVRVSYSLELSLQ